MLEYGESGDALTWFGSRGVKFVSEVEGGGEEALVGLGLVGRAVFGFLKDSRAAAASTTPSSRPSHDLNRSTNEGLVGSGAFEALVSSILMEFKVVVEKKLQSTLEVAFL